MSGFLQVVLVGQGENQEQPCDGASEERRMAISYRRKARYEQPQGLQPATQGAELQLCDTSIGSRMSQRIPASLHLLTVSVCLLTGALPPPLVRLFIRQTRLLSPIFTASSSIALNGLVKYGFPLSNYLVYSQVPYRLRRPL